MKRNAALMAARRRPPLKSFPKRRVSTFGPVSRDASYRPAPRLADLRRRGSAQLERGHRGPAVCFVQEVLNLLVEDRCPLRIDGLFGAETAAAVRAFQHRHGLAPTGRVPTDILLRLQREAIGRFEMSLERLGRADWN